MIRHLPADVRACIRTGVALTSFAQAVEELVLNGIDAGASSIAVRVDFSCFKIQVVDNGVGISLDQFQLIGERYSTSKCHRIEDLENLKYFGYRGEALASLRTASSFFEIVSRSKSSVVTYSKCFQNGNMLDIIQASQPRPSAGTTVTAHDLFYNLPVRRKHLNGVLEMEKIRYRLAGIALMWPQISFSLRDDSVGNVLLQTHKCSGMAASFSYVFTPARARGLMEVSAEKDEFKLTGLVSKESYSRMDLQFVFVNKRLVLKSSIHRQINKILGRSLILRRKGLTSDMIEKSLNAVGSTTGSPQKQIDRYAIFAVNVECPYNVYDITFDPSKTLIEFQNWPKLIHLLQDMLYGFLRKENLISVTEQQSTSPFDVNDEDDDDEEDNYQITANYGNATSVQNENGNANRNSSLEVIHKFGRNMSAVIENGLFSKSVQRPKVVNSVSVLVSPEQTKSNTDHSGQPPAALIFDQFQSQVCTEKAETHNLNQNENEKSTITNLDLPGNSKQESAQINAHSQRGVILSPEYSNSDIKCAGKPARKSESQNDHQSPVPCQLSSEDEQCNTESFSAAVKSSEIEDSEEVIVKGQTLSLRKEITLGSSLYYSSTLKSLRDIRQASSSSGVSDIITNTLQQLRKSSQKAVTNSDLFKTPEKSINLNNDNPSPPKLSKIEVGVKAAVSNIGIKEIGTVSNDFVNICKCNLEKTCSSNIIDGNFINECANQFGAKNLIGINKSVAISGEPSSSAIFKSTKEDRSLGLNDRTTGLKRTLDTRTSHASKLAKLMRGEIIVENLQETQDDNDQSLGSLKYAGVLNAFTYNRSHKNVSFKHDENILENSVCFPNAPFKDDAEVTGINSNVDKFSESKIISQEHLPNEGSNENTRVNDRDRWRVSQQITSSTHGSCHAIPCSKYSSCQAVCQMRKHFGHTETDLPFSTYRSTVDGSQHTEDEMDSSPKVSVILSLPLENVRSKTSQFETRDRPETARSVLLSDLNRCNNILEKDARPNITEPETEINETTFSLPMHTQGNLADSTCNNERQKGTKHVPEVPCFVQEQCHTFSQSGLEANNVRTHASQTPQLSQGFKVTMTQLDEADSETSTESIKSPIMLQCTKLNSVNESPTGSAGFSPTALQIDEESSLYKWSGNINPLVQCPENKVTASNRGTSICHVSLSDSDSVMYIKNTGDRESKDKSTEIICPEFVSSATRDSDFRMRNDMPDKGTQQSVQSTVTFSDMPVEGDAHIVKVVNCTTKDCFNLPVAACESVSHMESETNEGAVILAYDSLNDRDTFSTVPETVDTENCNLERKEDGDADIDLEQAAVALDKGDSKCILNKEQSDLTEVKNMLADAKLLFKNMKKSFNISDSALDPKTHDFDQTTVSVLQNMPAFSQDKNSENCSRNLTESKAHLELDESGKRSRRTFNQYHTCDCDLIMLVRPGEEDIPEDIFNLNEISSSGDSIPCAQRNIIGNSEESLCCISPTKANQRTEQIVFDTNSISSNDGQQLPPRHLHTSLCLSGSLPCNSLLKAISADPDTQGSSDVNGLFISQIPVNVVSSDVRHANFNGENTPIFTEINADNKTSDTSKYRHVLNPENSSQVLHLSNSKDLSSQTDIIDIMSVEGDKVLMMIDEPVLSPAFLSHACDSHGGENSIIGSDGKSHKRASGFSAHKEVHYGEDWSVDGEAIQKDESGISSISHKAENCIVDPNSDQVYMGGSGYVCTSNSEKAVALLGTSNSEKVVADIDIQLGDANPTSSEQVNTSELLCNKALESQEMKTKYACWKEVTDPETGQSTYINNKSGHTISEKQWTQMSSQLQREMLAVPSSNDVSVTLAPGPAIFSASEKQAFKDLVTEHFEQEENEAVSKWRKGERPVYDKNAQADVSALMASWTNPVFLNYKQPGLLADMCPSGSAARSCFNSLSLVEFNKNMLNTVKVIGQLDNKFIACMIEKPQDLTKVMNSGSNSLLVLFDQHAVHERIRLEQFTKDVYEVENDERTDRIKRSEVRPAQSVTMDQDDLRIMKAFNQEFNRIGISFSVDKTNRNMVHINSFPSCMLDSDASELKQKKIAGVIDNVETLIKEHIELLKVTNGTCGRLPLTIHRVLCSRACHGAVKFGDRLTLQECQDLLSSLSSCNLPFQCAHGRPSVAPLVNLSVLEKELFIAKRRPNLRKISQHITK